MPLTLFLLAACGSNNNSNSATLKTQETHFSCNVESVKAIVLEEIPIEQKVKKVLSGLQKTDELVTARSCFYSLETMDFVEEQSSAFRADFVDLASAVDINVSKKIWGEPATSNKKACNSNEVLSILNENNSIEEKVKKVLSDDKSRDDMIESRSCLYSLEMSDYVDSLSQPLKEKFVYLRIAVDGFVSAK